MLLLIAFNSLFEVIQLLLRAKLKLTGNSKTNKFGVTDKEIEVVDYSANREPNQSVIPGTTIEVRGQVGKDGKSLIFGDLTPFEGDFDPSSYEQMLDYYHGLCRNLTTSAN